MGFGQIVLGLLLLVAVVVLVFYRQPALAFGMRTRAYLKDVRSEIRKVSWPGWDDLKRSTIVIVIFVLAIGLLIGLMDWISSRVLIDGVGRLFG